MVSKHVDLAIRGKRTPVGHLHGHALVVIEDSNSRHRTPPSPKGAQLQLASPPGPGTRVSVGRLPCWLCTTLAVCGSHGNCRRRCDLADAAPKKIFTRPSTWRMLF